MPVRKWKRFPGRNHFFCNGLLVTANQIGILVFIVVLIVVEGLLFFAFDARFLVTHVEPIGIGVIFPIIAGLLLFYSLMFLLKAGCIDPGIVPRAPPDEVNYLIGLADGDSNGTSGAVKLPMSRYKNVVVNGQQVKLKWCATCNVWRPPRASHCGLCNNCYEVFDHHCPAVGNCVAKRNYRYFYLFLVVVTFGCLFVMGCNVAVIVLASLEDSFGDALKNYPASVIEFGIAGLTIISVSGLAAMHTWLIARMETTNEDIKGTFNPRRQGSDVRNPYQQRNCCLNFGRVVFGPFPPSLIDRRGFVDVSLLDEEEGYGSTISSVPKLPPESQSPYPVQPSSYPVQPPVTTPGSTEQEGTRDEALSSKEVPTVVQPLSPPTITAEIEVHQDSPGSQQDSPESQSEEESQQLIAN